MNMKRPRMTVGRWLVVVGLVAAGLAAGPLVARSVRYAVRATEHERQAARDRAGLAQVEASQSVVYLGLEAGAESRGFAVGFLRASREHHLALAAKYRRASMRPWCAVEPDPTMGPNPFPTLEPLADGDGPRFLPTENGGEPL